MATINTIQEEITATQSVQSLSSIYEKIAVMHIAKTKGSVMQARQFSDTVIQTLHVVRVLAAQTGEQIHKSKKEIHVLLSANNRLYGDIIHDVYRLFLEKSQLSTGDIVIMGDIGKELYEQQGSKKPYTFFAIPDNDSDAYIHPLCDMFHVYEHVYIYYGKCESAFKQIPFVLDISGTSTPVTTSLPLQDQPYLCEPSVEVINSSCEKHIFTSLLKQTLHEIELARYASRIQSMEKTHEQSILRLERLAQEAHGLRKRAENAKQLEQLGKVRYMHQKRRNGHV